MSPLWYDVNSRIVSQFTHESKYYCKVEFPLVSYEAFKGYSVQTYFVPMGLNNNLTYVKIANDF